MKILKLFPTQIYVSKSKFPWLIILLIYKVNPFRIFGIFRKLLKETNSKLGVLRWEKEGYIKYLVVDIEKPGHQATWLSSNKHKKYDEKEKQMF